ncbi:MAG: hypothetical protein ACOYWZ_15470 [Bacillota bacterium]
MLKRLVTSRIIIKGIPLEKPKINKDGLVELRFRIPMSLTIPRGLSDLGASNYIVYVSPRMWKRISHKVNDETCYYIQGELKPSVSIDGVPFIEVVCFNIDIKMIV